MLTKTVEVVTPRGSLTFAIQSGKSRRRVSRLLEKEPETIRWIESFDQSAVYWDVGANTGGFALFAALDPHTRVLAFEPGAVNHYLLALSAELNDLDRRVSTFCLGFDENTRVLDLSASQRYPAASFHVHGQGEGTRFASHQTMLSFSIDDFVNTFDVPLPTHLKIDVPNMPGAILRGAARTLNQGSTREILIELDRRTFSPGGWDGHFSWLRSLGFGVVDRFAKKDSRTADYLFRRDV